MAPAVRNPLLGTRNQLANVSNPYQGKSLKVLFVCSAGLLRSPTAAHLFSAPPYNWNTRCAGADAEYALIPVSEALLCWADRIYFMAEHHKEMVYMSLGESVVKLHESKMFCLGDIPDEFGYRQPELQKALLEAVEKTLPVIIPPTPL